MVRVSINSSKRKDTKRKDREALRTSNFGRSEILQAVNQNQNNVDSGCD